MTEHSSGSTDKALGFSTIFGTAAVLCAVALAVFGIQGVQETVGAQEAGSFAFAGAMIFAMLSVFALQWWSR